MVQVIRAKVLTNSSEDSLHRVKLQADGVWEESDLVLSVNAIPLVEGDTVYVDVSEFDNPLILGKASMTTESLAHDGQGSVLFQSSDGSKYSIAFVKNNSLAFYNSEGVEITVEGDTVHISSPKLKVEGNAVVPSTSGPFCAIKSCPFTGAPHLADSIAK